MVKFFIAVYVSAALGSAPLGNTIYSYAASSPKDRIEQATIDFVNAIYKHDRNGIHKFIKNSCVPYTRKSIAEIEAYAYTRIGDIKSVVVDYIDKDIIVTATVEQDGELVKDSYMFYVEKYEWVGYKIYMMAYENKSPKEHHNKSIEHENIY